MDISILLTSACHLTHNSFAGVNPLAGLGGLNFTRRTSARYPIAGAFFVPAVRVMAAVRGRPKGLPAPSGRSANLCTVVTNSCLAASGDDSHITLGIDTMHLPVLHLSSAINSSKTHRAKAHRAMARAALRSDSSLHHHINKARQLESQGGAE